jgi:hypothetical protein
MSKDIVCSRSEAAESTLPQYIFCYKNICKNLSERLKTKLNTKNPYLLTVIGRAIFYLERCDVEIEALRHNDKKLSRGAVSVLQTPSTRFLDNIKHLESLIQPLENDWTAIPWDIQSECATIVESLFLVVVDLYLLTGIARFAYTPRSDPSN